MSDTVLQGFKQQTTWQPLPLSIVEVENKMKILSRITQLGLHAKMYLAQKKRKFFYLSSNYDNEDWLPTQTFQQCNHNQG